MFDAIGISDLHIGAKNCEYKRLRKFLHSIEKGEIKTQMLIIAGDGYDLQNEKKIKHKHWKVVKAINKVADLMPVIWLTGNHDPEVEFIQRFSPKVTIMESFIFKSGDVNVFVDHGHIHDSFMESHPLLTNIADAVYRLSQMVDPSHKLAKHLKHSSKSFIKCAQKITFGIAVMAAEKGCSVAWHGHNHHAGRNIYKSVETWDSGCWTELPGSYLTIKKGITKLHWV